MSIRKTITTKANRLISMAVNSVAQKGSERFLGAESADALRLLARQMGAEGIVTDARTASFFGSTTFRSFSSSSSSR